uniref:Uncharacterized protein n=1 Tax=Ciona savignyi TaxID=51511 RepID=H2Z7M4_CIOSA
MEDKKSSSSMDTKEQEDTDGTPALEGLNIDDKLEEKLKKHGLNRRNVKTIIHELLHDENVREMLKSNLSGGSDAAGGSSLQFPRT